MPLSDYVPTPDERAIEQEAAAYFCPGCRDTGFRTHSRPPHGKVGRTWRGKEYEVTYATPCPTCRRGACIEDGMAQHWPKRNRSPRMQNRELTRMEREARGLPIETPPDFRQGG